MRTRVVTIGICAAMLSAAVTSCADTPGEGGAQTSAASAPQSVREPAPTPAPTAETPEPDQVQVVRMEGVLPREYFLPTIEEFTRSEPIAGLIEGRVVSTEAVVSPDEGQYVSTLSTVEVTVASTPELVGTRVTVREDGGTVTKREVRSIFESKMDEPLSEAELNETISFEVADDPNSVVGENVLVWLGQLDRPEFGDVVYYSAARMILDATNTFRWAGGAPLNPEWANEVPAAGTDALLSAATQ